MPDTDGKKSKKHVGRHDLTKELEAAQRRWDSFAKLLAGHSECVAVTIIGEKIYITANELHPAHKGEQGGNKTYITIVAVMKYFQEIAKGIKRSAEEREVIFCKHICTTGRFKEAAKPDLAKSIAKEVMTFKDPTISEIIKKYSSDFDMASRMYSEFSVLYEDFLKLEEGLISDEPQYKELKKTFEQLSESSILSKEEKGTHAEMQMLAEIIESGQLKKMKPDQRVYIGISKLCCLGCRCMLEAANDAIKESKFLTRGRHDIDFPDNWKPPKKLKMGFDAFLENEMQTKLRSAQSKQSIMEEQKKDIAFIIGFKGHEAISSCRKVKEEAKKVAEEKSDAVSMAASQSDSEPDAKIDHKITNFKQKLSEHLSFIKNIQKSSSDSKEMVELTEIAINLHELQEFRDLLKRLDNRAGQASLGRAVLGLLTYYNDKYEKKLNKEILQKIVSIADLVGNELAQAYTAETQSTVSKKSFTPSFDKDSSKTKRPPGTSDDGNANPSKKQKTSSIQTKLTKNK